MLGLAFAGPGPASAASELAVGIADDAALQYEPSDARAAETVAAWRASGVDTVRIVAEWQKVSPAVTEQRAPAGFDPADPEDTRYGWGRLDRAVNLARAAGLRIVLVVTGPGPLWSVTRPSDGSPRRYPRPDLFARFARAVATRYGRAVDRYVIWNEPNVPLWLQPQYACPARPSPARPCTSIAPHLYRELYRAGDAAIHAADPGSRVWFGALAPRGHRPLSRNAQTRPLPFLRALACRDAPLRRLRTGPCRRFRPLRSDGLAYHAHGRDLGPDEPGDEPDEATLGDLPHLERLLDALQRLGGLRRHGGSPVPFGIHLTELGWETDPPDPRHGVSPALQALHLQQAAHLAWRDPRVRTLLQYEWRDEPLARGQAGAPAYSAWQSGLRFADDRPKPALAAFPQPFWVETPAPGGGRAGRAQFWGQVRPGGAHVVSLQGRSGPGRPWTPLARVRTDERGFWTLRRAVVRAAQYRFAWAPSRGPRARAAAPAGRSAALAVVPPGRVVRPKPLAGGRRGHGHRGGRALDRQHGGVVVLVALAPAGQRPIHRGDGVVGAGAARQGVAQAVLAEAVRGALGVEHAIRVEDQHVPGRHRHAHRPPSPLAEGPEQRAPAPDRLDAALAHEQRQRVAGADDVHVRAGVVLLEDRGGHGAQSGARTLQQLAVELLERGHGAADALAGGPQRVAGHGGERRSLGAAAGDVADDEHPPVLDAEGVVEVAAHPVLAPGRAVQGRGGPPRDGGEARRQEAGLQRPRDPRALPHHAAVLQRRARAAPQLGDQRDVVLGDGPPRLRADQGQRADRGARGGDRAR